MSSKHVLYIICCLFLGNAAMAQKCGHTGKVMAKTTIATPEEDYYDVKYVKIDLNATNTSTAISGSSITRAVVVAPSMSEYYFELTNQLTIDDVQYNGVSTPVTPVSNFVNKITLPSAIPQGTTFEVEVFYHGAPVGGTGFFTIGILNGQAGTPPVQVTHTVSAAYHSRDWFPCKQSLTDKIDSADIWITVPLGLNVASNGLLKNTTPSGIGMNRYEWSTRYPVDYYLLSFAVAPYNEYNYHMHFPDGDSMLVQNYIYNDPNILLNSQDELDSIEQMINHFSYLFGKYPFYKEKTGTVLAPLSGGMENQTMVTLGNHDITLIAHELAHQWWGDAVTCGTIKDMWLNEGWATYCEHLYLEHFHGPQAALGFRNSVFGYVVSAAGGSVYVSDTTDELRVYDGRLTYYKGAGVAHMFRYILNNDSLFREIIRAYHQQYAYTTATTADLNTLANQMSGQTLDTFFSQWVFKEGYPIYSARWAQSGNQVFVKLKHTSSKPTSVPVFKLPVEIKLKSPQGDTVIRVYNDQSEQLYTFTWNNAMTTMQIDPDNHIINTQGLIANDPSLSVEGIDKTGIAIAPNPTSTGWTLHHLPGEASINLFDIQGRLMLQQNMSAGNNTVPASLLAPGTYLITVYVKDKPSVSFHVVKQ